MSGDKLNQDNEQAPSAQEVEEGTKEPNQSGNEVEQPTNEQVAASEVKSEEQAGHPHPRDSVTPPEGAGRQQVAEDTLAVKGLTLKMQTSGEEAELTARTDGDTTNRSEVKGSGVQGSLSSRQSTPRTGQRPTSGRKQVSTRPYSAMDAYRYIVAHPIKTNTEAGYNTSYQRQRTEAWKQTAAKSSNMEDVIKVSVVPVVTKSEGRRKSPPPQRPSSPAAIIRIQSANHHHSTTRPSSALHVKVGSDWLAGGRDIFWENVQKRPRSGHVPGWKEGLPESMKRPRSAVANRTLRRSRASTPVTPSSLMYESMLHGYPTPNGSLPELTDLSDYPHSSGSHRIRMLGTPQGGQAEFYTTPPHDTVYRWS